MQQTKKYKLINLSTKEEHLCYKVTIDGFNYYVSKFINKIGSYINENGKPIVKYVKDLGEDLIWESIDGKSSACDGKLDFKSVVATNNTNIDIPQVVDDVDKFIKETFYAEDGINFKRSTIGADDLISGFKIGYNKSQETHHFNDKDMIEFAEFYFREEFNSTMQDCKSSDEILQLWKEQKPITLYYQN